MWTMSTSSVLILQWVWLTFSSYIADKYGNMEIWPFLSYSYTQLDLALSRRALSHSYCTHIIIALSRRALSHSYCTRIILALSRRALSDSRCTRIIFENLCVKLYY